MSMDLMVLAGLSAYLCIGLYYLVNGLHSFASFVKDGKEMRGMTKESKRNLHSSFEKLKMAFENHPNPAIASVVAGLIFATWGVFVVAAWPMILPNGKTKINP